jgi:hypothetical protein
MPRLILQTVSESIGNFGANLRLKADWHRCKLGVAAGSSESSELSKQQCEWDGEKKNE